MFDWLSVHRFSVNVFSLRCFVVVVVVVFCLFVCFLLFLLLLLLFVVIVFPILFISLFILERPSPDDKALKFSY